MDQNSIVEILNRHIFREDKPALIEAIAKNPDRYIGAFRSTTPRLKLMQNILQSREIRFGDALEEVVTDLLAEKGFINLPKRLIIEEQDDLSCDQYFASSDQAHFYLVEQKVRDDHDSTKKRGQIDNFRKKISQLVTTHGAMLTAIMYFIDPSLHKNQTYYRNQLADIQSEFHIPVYLFYNGEFFQFLEGDLRTWHLLLNSLTAWRQSTPEEIIFDYDIDPKQTIKDLENISAGIWQRILENNALWEDRVIKTLFPTGASLQLLHTRFLNLSAAGFRTGRGQPQYSQLAYLLAQQLKKYYGISSA